MKTVLAELHEIINSLEEQGFIKEAEVTNKLFIRLAQRNKYTAVIGDNPTTILRRVYEICKGQGMPDDFDSFANKFKSLNSNKFQTGQIYPGDTFFIPDFVVSKDQKFKNDEMNKKMKISEIQMQISRYQTQLSDERNPEAQKRIKNAILQKQIELKNLQKSK
jgi:hypothetical protein